MKRKLLKNILCATLLISALSACNNQSTIKTTSIALDETTKSMYVSEVGSLTASVKPDNATDKTVTWSSSDNSILTVDKDGNLSAVKEGNCYVTAKTNDSGLEAKCDITVTPYIACTKFSFGSSDYTIDKGGSKELNVTFTPSTTSCKQIVYEVEDPTIVSVSEDGVVVGLKEGTTKVYASHKDIEEKVRLNFTVKESFETGLFIGEKPIIYEGSQYEQKYGNYFYKYETNTLTIDCSVITDISLKLKTYSDIRVGSIQEKDDVNFLLAYEGTRDLHIELAGDIKINFSQTSGYVGFLYVKNDVNVYINGPSRISTSTLNHSLIYGEKANFSFSFVDIDINVNSMAYGMDLGSAKFASCNLDFQINKESTETSNYAGLYTGDGISTYDSSIIIEGFQYGCYCGTSFLYHSNLDIDATFIAVKFYALTTYDSLITLNSDMEGGSFYDGLYMHNGKITSYAKSDISIGSVEATIMFDNVEVDATCESGCAIQAWRILASDSSIEAKSNNGYGLMVNYNAHVPEDEKAMILIHNTTVSATTIEDGSCAIWGVGLFVLENATFTNEEKYLYEDIVIKGVAEDQIFAIVDKTVNKLQYEEIEAGYRPLNGVKSLQIQAQD